MTKIDLRVESSVWQSFTADQTRVGSGDEIALWDACTLNYDISKEKVKGKSRLQNCFPQDDMAGVKWKVLRQGEDKVTLVSGKAGNSCLIAFPI